MNDKFEKKLRELVKELCHTPLLVTGQFVIVDETQRETHGRVSRKTIAEPDELLDALAWEIRILKLANDYLKSQLSYKESQATR